jgi:hypothetical protein
MPTIPDILIPLYLPTLNHRFTRYAVLSGINIPDKLFQKPPGPPGPITIPNNPRDVKDAREASTL